MQRRRHWAAMTIGIAVGVGTVTVSLAQDQQGGNLQEVVVTGSRIRGVANVDTPNPVTTLSADELLATGSLSIGDTLNDLPALRGTFTSANSARFIGTAGLNLLDLRGLGAERTLVLVNGRRYVSALDGAQVVDTNSLSGDLLERVDIITGGASSIYGSDAIAGVVNFVQRQDYEGMGLSLQSGLSSRGDGESTSAAFTMGRNFADGRGNIAASVEYSREEELVFNDRRSTRFRQQFVLANQDNQDDGIPDRIFNRDTRSTNLTSGGLFNPILQLTPTQRQMAGSIFFRPENNAPRLFNFNTDGTLSEFDYGARDFRPNANSLNGGSGGGLRELGDLSPGIDRKSFTLLSHYDFNDKLKLFGDVRFVRADTYSLSPIGPAFNSAAGVPIAINLDNPFLSQQARSLVTQFLPTGATSFTIGRNNVDLGDRGEDTNRETFRIVAGLRGDLTDHLGYEVSLNFGRTDIESKVLGNRLERNFVLAADAVRAADGTVQCRARLNAAGAVVTTGDSVIDNCVPINVLGAGNISREGRNYVIANSTQDARIDQEVATAFVTYDTGAFFELPGGPISAVLGLEYRDEASRAAYSPDVVAGLTFLNAIQPVDESYSVKETFSEVRLPVLRDLPGVEELTFTGSLRYADYSLKNTNTIETWSGGVQYAPIRDIRFRAGVSKAVRAPTIGDLFMPLTQNFANGLRDPCDRRFISNGTANRAANCAAAGLPANFDNTLAMAQGVEIRSGGNSGLVEEESRSVTAGVVLEPRFVPGLQITVDYYNIEVNSVIAQVGSQDIVDNCYDSASLNNMFCSLVFRDPATGFFFGGDNPGPIGGGILQSSLNFSALIVKGIDAEIAYTFNWDRVGRINTRFIGSYVRQKDQFPFLDDPRRPDQILEEVGDPKYEFQFSLGLDRGKFSANYSMRWIESQYVDQIENIRFIGGRPPVDPDFSDIAFTGSKMLHNIRFAYQMSDSLNAFFGIDNITDELPPLGFTGTTDGGSIYSTTGQFFYGGLKWKFQ